MSDTMEPHTRLWRFQDRWLEVTFLSGQAGVFFVNALTALVQPNDFTELVEESAVGRWLDSDGGSWLGPIIAANDLLMCIALLSGIWYPRIRLVVLAWAGIWLLAVTTIRMTALEAFPW